MAKDRDRTRSDLAGVGPDPTYAGELVRMHDLKGFKVASGEPDIRGWDVCTLAGADVGEVDDLLVVYDVGAYGAAMGHTYLRRPLPPEVLIDGDQWRIIRRRQTLDELLALETE